MDLKWDKDSLKDLIDIVKYIKKNKIGEILEPIADFYIEKHLNLFNFKNYAMDFTSECAKEIDLIEKIKNGEYKLAFICELSCIYHYTYDLKNKIKTKVKKQKFNNVYCCISQMIYYSVFSNFRIFSNGLNYKSFYLVSILKDVFLSNKILNSKDDKNLEVLNLAYFITCDLKKIEKENSKIIYNLPSLMLECENLDISIMSKKNIREFLNILETKRTLFVRILLILSFELIKNPEILNSNWLFDKIIFNNKNEFINVIKSPLIETVLFLTAYRISNE